MGGALASLLGSHPIAAGRSAITLTASGNAQIDTGSFKIGSSSGLFDGTGIPYANANWKLDDTLVFNSSTVTRTGGTPQTAINQPSIDKYFIHSYQDSVPLTPCCTHL